MSRMSDGKVVPLKPLKWYRELATSKGRIEAGAFLVEGDRAVRQIIGNHPHQIIEIVTIADLPPVYRNYPTRFVTERQLRTICLTKTPQGPVAVVRLPADMYSDHLPENAGAKILLLEDVQDPGNVGALIRTAAAFNFSGVIVTEKCADPFSPKCVQATAGTVLSVWLRRTDRCFQLVEMLKKDEYYFVAADLQGSEVTSILSCQGKILLALGNEASGLSKPMLDESDVRLRIPIVREKAESLNVAACGAICMYLSSRQG